MPEVRVECVACNEPLRVRADADRCRCDLCDTMHVVDRSVDPPSVRPTDPEAIAVALATAQRDLKAIAADVRFLEPEASAQRRQTMIAVLGVAFLCIVGGILVVSGVRQYERTRADATSGTFLMPTMSREEQNGVAVTVVGGVLLLIGLLAAFLLPWRRWKEPGQALRIARSNREHLEGLVRRIAERARPPAC
ncbi:MAG: hypothetical protein AAB434_05500 [Planctomycetota bacterium]